MHKKILLVTRAALDGIRDRARPAAAEAQP
jgi:hypothetical protein